MKLISYILCFLFCFSVCFSQTSPLTFTTITNDYLRPGSGAMNWNDLYQIPIPPGGATGVNAGLDRYIRFAWNQVQNDNGTYNFAALDIRINLAIANGQSFSLGIMPYIEGGNGTTINGGTATFPTYLYTLMAAENPISVWKSPVDGYWIPNVNSPNYITEWNKLMVAIANHINSTSSGGVPYSKIIFYHDIRGYGNFGEWHNFPYDQQTGWPTYFWPTAASLDTIIENYKRIYPKNHLVMLLGAFASGGDSHVPLEVTYRLLTTQNGAGYIGWRRDNWGDEVNYTSILENNPNSFNGLAFKTQIMSQWQRAIITGEPLSGPPASPTYSALSTEMIRYGVTSYGNGNVTNPNDATIISNMQAGSKTSGARLLISSGTISSIVNPGLPFNLTLFWQNIGVAPVYERWNVQFELRNTANTTVFQTWTSNFNPKLFLPGTNNFADILTLGGGIAVGNYNLYLIIRDSSGYRPPYPLSITGRLPDGSYLLKSNLAVTAATNTPPTSNPGGNFNITLPITTVTAAGGGTFVSPATSITGFLWTQVSGPSTATIVSATSATTVINALITVGVYVFNLRVTDNNGFQGNNTMNVTVAAAPKPPTANAGTNQTITLPTTTSTLTGSGTFFSPATSITNFKWTQINGPIASTITSSTLATTSVTGLTVAGTYIYSLVVTDNNGLTGTASVSITVNAAPLPPTANAGTNQTIQLPLNQVTLNGSGTFFSPAISITTYLWTKTSGPATGTITSTSSPTTTVTGLVQGTYVFTLKVTDNRGLSNSVTVTITVNAANAPPVSHPGNAQTITLPTSSITVNGTGTPVAPATSITAFKWVQLSGPATATITSSTSATTTITALSTAGAYVFQLTVTDNNGLLGSANITITVNPQPLPPTANAGTNQTIRLPTSTVTVTGTGTFHAPATSITTFHWVKTSGPTGGAITNVNAASTTITGLTQGVYVYTLTVTDNRGLTGTSSVTITVNPPLQPPVPNAGPSQTITLPVSQVTLPGTATIFAPAVSITTWLWTFVSGPATFTIVSPNAQNTNIIGMTTAGTYIFQLRVTDNLGSQGTNTVQIVVNPVPILTPPIVSAGANRTIMQPKDTVHLAGTATPVAPANAITTYLWTFVSGPAGSLISNPSVINPSITNMELQGVYTFNLKVTDNNGLTNSSNVTVTVNPANPSPIANAGTAQATMLPADSVTLTGSGQAQLPATSIISYLWTQSSGPNTATITSPTSATTKIHGLIFGVYSFRLQVTDNNGLIGFAPVTVVVLGALPNNGQYLIYNRGKKTILIGIN